MRLRTEEGARALRALRGYAREYARACGREVEIERGKFYVVLRVLSASSSRR